MTEFDDLPVPDGPDPIESDDLITLRAEILRLREGLLGTYGRIEVFRDRIAQLEEVEHRLHAESVALHGELARNPLMRVARAMRRTVIRPT